MQRTVANENEEKGDFVMLKSDSSANSFHKKPFSLSLRRVHNFSITYRGEIPRVRRRIVQDHRSLPSP